MNGEINDLGKWTWYTSKFLNSCDNSTIDANEVINEFLKQEGFDKENLFHTWNHASVLMALYGLFVIPKEFWRNRLGDDNNERAIADELIFENFQFLSRATFRGNEEYTKIMNKEVFLRRFRNSIAHANFEIDQQQNILIFKNFDQYGIMNFEVTNNLSGLSEFIGEMKYNSRNNSFSQPRICSVAE